MKFIGRQAELQALENLYRSPASQLVIAYGRRRVGKSTLIKQFALNKLMLSFEGLEHANTDVQVSHFTKLLKKQLKKERLLQKANFANWSEIFDFLADYAVSLPKNKKLILFFDEFQWMAANQSRLVSLIKYYWDNHWKNQNIMLVLCGSIASFMVKNVVRSKALYGRASLSIKVGKLLPQDARQMLPRRSDLEALNYLILLGGIPKYLEILDQSKSFEQNIANLFFSRHPLLADELNQVFYSHFREPQFYLRIIKSLLTGAKSLDELARKLKVNSSGGLKGYLENLELADFIRTETPFLNPQSTKLKKYRIADEYLLFFAKYLKNSQKLIADGGGESLFKSKILKTWSPWLGLAFEAFCLNNALFLAERMGFEDKVESFGPFFLRGDKGFQIDLAYKRTDKVITICEVKYHNKPITTAIIPEIKQKLQILKIPKSYSLEHALIAPHGADKALIETQFFHHIISKENLFSK